MAKGKLVVISGPSGTGKTSICNALLERLENSCWSVSATTRPQRAGETDGESYIFLTPQEFDQRLANDAFLETAEYLGHRYGTPIEPARAAIEQGQLMVMEIDVQGGAQVAERFPDSIRIFVLPPTMQTLKNRLEGRQTESKQQQQQRIAKADGEIGFARDSGCYTHFVTNDVLDQTVDEIIQIIQSA